MWKLGVFPILFLGKSTFKQNLSALGAVRVEFFSNQKTRTGGARGQLRSKKAGRSKIPVERVTKSLFRGKGIHNTIGELRCWQKILKSQRS